MKKGYVYIITNKRNGTLYIGVTSDLVKRINQHNNDMIEGFSKKYRLKMLVYYEEYLDIYDAISREKYLKGKKREYKLDLINGSNPKWNDLSIGWRN